MKPSLFIAVLLLLAAGCASKLQVDIQILKRSHLQSDPRILLEVLSSRDKALRMSLDDFGRKKAELQQQLTAYVMGNPCFFGDPRQAQQIVGAINQSIEKSYTLAFTDITTGLAKKDSATLTDNRILQRKLLREALALFNRAASQVSQIQVSAAGIINKPRTGCPETFANRTQQVNLQKTVQEVIQVTRIQHALINDPLASYVVSAPDSCWKSTINRVLGKTIMGNADIAVVMESNDGFNEYTIKGIRNDASQATKAVFSLLNTSVDVIARAYGVGLSSASTASDTVPNFTKQNLQTAQDLDRYKRTVRLAQVNMLRNLLDQRASLARPGDTTAYKAALVAIKTSFAANKKRLTP